MKQFHGQLNQDQFIFERYFQNKSNGIAIECGAFDGVIESSTLFFELNSNWTCLNIEACPYLFDKLLENRPTSFNFNVGLSDKISVETFTHAIHPFLGMNFGNGSLHHTKDHLASLNEIGCKFIDYQVNTVTYRELIDSFMTQRFPEKTIDLFVLDVEGHELNVLQGMTNSKYLPMIVCVEYPHCGLDSITELMKDLTYTLDVCKENNAYFIKT